jgi:hypothetical protein
MAWLPRVKRAEVGTNMSASRPGPEFVGIADGPDVLDFLACEVEREHRGGDAVVLGHQARLAVDGALEERQAGFPAGDARVEAGDLLGRPAGGTPPAYGR